MGGRDALDLVPDVVDRSKPRSAPSRAASSAAIIQSGRAVPGGVTFWRQTLTRPSRFVVVPALLRVARRPAARRRPAATDSVRNRSTATTKPAPASARSARPRSGKSASGSAPRSTRRADATFGRRTEDRRWRRDPTAVGHRAPRVGEPRRARRRARRAREAGPARGPCRARRARCPGGGQVGSGPSGRAAASTAAASATDCARLRDRRTADDHDDVVAVAVEQLARGDVGGGHARDPRESAPSTSACARAAASPGRYSRLSAACGVSPSTAGAARSGGAACRPPPRAGAGRGPAAPPSGRARAGRRAGARHASSMVARGSPTTRRRAGRRRAGRRRCRCR